MKSNKELDRLIDMALEDGVLTDKERAILKKKAQELGVDEDELDLILENRLHKTKKSSSYVSSLEKKLKKEIGSITEQTEIAKSLEVKDNYTRFLSMLEATTELLDNYPLPNTETDCIEALEYFKKELKQVSSTSWKVTIVSCDKIHDMHGEGQITSNAYKMTLRDKGEKIEKIIKKNYPQTAKKVNRKKFGKVFAWIAPIFLLIGLLVIGLVFPAIAIKNYEFEKARTFTIGKIGIKKIATKQYPFLIKQGLTQKAYHLALEDDCLPIYLESIKQNLTAAYEKDKDDLLLCISYLKPITTPIVEERTIEYEVNDSYVAEVNSINTALVALINYTLSIKDFEYSLSVANNIWPTLVVTSEDGGLLGAFSGKSGKVYSFDDSLKLNKIEEIQNLQKPSKR